MLLLKNIAYKPLQIISYSLLVFSSVNFIVSMKKMEGRFDEKTVC